MILASGGGSAAEALVEATQDGRLAAEVGLVVCSRAPDQAGIHARVAGLNARYGLDIETTVINGHTHPVGGGGRGQTLAESDAIAERVRDGGFDHVALVGYMRIVRGALLEQYGFTSKCSSIHAARMSNTHPGPLPETRNMYGLRTAEHVLELGMRTTRHTLHLVADGVDEGPTLAAHPVEVRSDDTPQTLLDRVLVVERTALPYAIGNFLRAQVAYAAARPPLMPSV